MMLAVFTHLTGFGTSRKAPARTTSSRLDFPVLARNCTKKTLSLQDLCVTYQSRSEAGIAKEEKESLCHLVDNGRYDYCSPKKEPKGSYEHLAVTPGSGVSAWFDFPTWWWWWGEGGKAWDNRLLACVRRSGSLVAAEGNMLNYSGDDISVEYSYTYDEIDPKTAPCPQSEMGTFTRYFSPVVLSVVFVVGLVGNGLVLAVLGRRRCPWLLADCYLFQLALADILLVLALPFWAVEFTQGWVFEKGFCKFLGALSSMNSYSTVFLLACISVERYLAIVHAVLLQHRWKLFHTCLSSAVLWVICCGLSAVELHFYTVSFISQAERFICHLGFEAQEAESWRLGLRLTSFLLGFLLPVLVMSFCYGRIFVRLQRARVFGKLPALRLLLVILVLFVVSWAPFHVFRLMDSLRRQGHFGRDCAWGKALDYGLLFTQSLGLVHCCLNPLVYAFMGVKFRRELSRLWHRQDTSEGHRASIFSCEYSQATEHITVQGIDYDYSIMM
ncbi:C-X-C chemokine receptor type 3-2-like [Eublepharis macularius]|uniref:C-X-C chemokine receptor type 3-2-like n=1 Tax=Eublepharis macularius TaxID=481883 RepID=A0AA97KFF4_EUBMA|nr:C-X-C chemokine receptor type 3-2-like [Eublepharis macularius]